MDNIRHKPLTHAMDKNDIAPQSSLPSPAWLITGGAGFIGRNLIKRLVANGAPYIRVLDNLSTGSLEELSQVCALGATVAGENQESHPGLRAGGNAPQVELVVGDIREPSACLEAARGMDVVVHLAANTGVAPSVADPRSDMEANVIGTLNMLEAARANGVKRFIFASSGAPVGECEPPIHEELAPHPVSPYGASKLAGEGYCSAYYRTFGIETVCLRFGNVYGPLSNHKSSVVAKFIRQALAGEVCEIYGDGNQTRDFIYVEDLVDAVVKAAENQVGGETFQIATNREHTVNEVVQILSTQLQSKAGRALLTRNMGSRLGDVRRNFSNTAKALRVLNWQSRVPLDEGISLTLDWFLANIEKDLVKLP